MSKQNKWAGGFGKVASGGSSTTGGNTYSAPKAGAAPRANSSTSNNIVNMQTRPGDNMGTSSISTHNDINAFTRGIKSRGPYGGPNFQSLNHFEKVSKGDNPSTFPTPSSGGSSSSRGTVGGSGKGMTKSSKVGSGSTRATSQMAKAPSDNKKGSGYMASVK